jgi:hypothetical protein
LLQPLTRPISSHARRVHRRVPRQERGLGSTPLLSSTYGRNAVIERVR